jgi:hypothetical protein
MKSSISWPRRFVLVASTSASWLAVFHRGAPPVPDTPTGAIVASPPTRHDVRRRDEVLAVPPVISLFSGTLSDRARPSLSIRRQPRQSTSSRQRRSRSSS